MRQRVFENGNNDRALITNARRGGSEQDRKFSTGEAASRGKKSSSDRLYQIRHSFSLSRSSSRSISISINLSCRFCPRLCMLRYGRPIHRFGTKLGTF